MGDFHSRRSPPSRVQLLPSLIWLLREDLEVDSCLAPPFEIPCKMIHGRRYPYMCMHRLDTSYSILHIQGEAMAGRLYIDAVERQSIPADPEITAYLRLHQPSEAAVGSQELPSQLSSQALSYQAPAAAKQKPRANKRQKSSKDPAVSHSLSLPC